MFKIKRANEAYEEKFEKILDDNPQYVIIGSFSFSVATNWYKKLASLKCPKLVIIPYKYYCWNKERTINYKDNIKILVDDGIGVIINSLQHAKFILTDKECFDGSNNLTYSGFNTNIENSNFYLYKLFPKEYNELYKEILCFTKEQIYNFASIENAEERYLQLEKGNLDELFFATETNHLSEYLDKIRNTIMDTKDLENNIKLVNDSFQHMGREYTKVIGKSYSLLKELENINWKLENIFNVLLSQYRQKNNYEEIWIKDLQNINADINIINAKKDKLHLLYKEILDNFRRKSRFGEDLYIDLAKDRVENIVAKNTINIKYVSNSLFE